MAALLGRRIPHGYPKPGGPAGRREGGDLGGCVVVLQQLGYWMRGRFLAGAADGGAVEDHQQVATVCRPTGRKPNRCHSGPGQPKPRSDGQHTHRSSGHARFDRWGETRGDSRQPIGYQERDATAKGMATRRSSHNPVSITMAAQPVTQVQSPSRSAAANRVVAPM